jgi:hypothetical protein
MHRCKNHQPLSGSGKKPAVQRRPGEEKKFPMEVQIWHIGSYTNGSQLNIKAEKDPLLLLIDAVMAVKISV